LVRVGRKDGVIAYWNNLVPRRHPPFLDENLIEDTARMKELRKVDRGFLYSDFIIDRIIK
jgi:hypothetical protein